MKFIKFFYLIIKPFYKLLPKFIRKLIRERIIFIFDLLKMIKSKFFDSKYYISKSIDELKIEYFLIESMSNRKSILNTQILIEQNGRISELKAIKGSVLDLNLYFFEKITLLGGTDTLIYKNRLYNQELLSMKSYHDLKQSDIFLSFNKKVKYDVFLNSKITELQEKNVVYITLLKEHSQNYYHWMTEIMPRAIFTSQKLSEDKYSYISRNKKIIFLIDEDIPNQCLEVLKYCINLEYSIKIIPKNEMLSCTNLVYCSPFWQSLDNTTGIIPDPAEFFLDKYALELVHDAIYKKINLEKNEPFRKIYLQRKPSQIRSIINNDEIERFMIDNNYEIIDTAELSFLEQVKFFFQAKIVIGASGATFTNILCMQPNTIAIIFYPSHPATNHGIFQPLADVSGVNLFHYKTIPEDDESVHSNFRVNINSIKKILKDIGK